MNSGVVPEYLDIDHMMTTIMRMFPAYDIAKLLHTPFAHILKLYNSAEKATAHERYDILIGTAALHDKDLARDLQRAVEKCTIPDREIMKKLTSKENIKLARERALQQVTKE